MFYIVEIENIGGRGILVIKGGIIDLWAKIASGFNSRQFSTARTCDWLLNSSRPFV
jgi:hypothetical protein